MARPCGCGGDAAALCNCVVQAGDGATVTGTGTPESPYVVSADPVTIDVTDTCTVDMTLTGTNPYTLSGDVKISADAENALTQGTDCGLFVQGGATGALNVGCGLSGAGSVDSPLELDSPQTISGFSVMGAAQTFTGAQLCAGGTLLDEPNRLTITNPSGCQDMLVDVEMGGRIRLDHLDDAAANGLLTAQFTFLRDGNPIGQAVQALGVGRGGATAANNDIHLQQNHPIQPITLLPGESVTLGVRFSTSLSGTCPVAQGVINMPGIKAMGHLI